MISRVSASSEALSWYLPSTCQTFCDLFPKNSFPSSSPPGQLLSELLPGLSEAGLRTPMSSTVYLKQPQLWIASFQKLFSLPWIWQPFDNHHSPSARLDRISGWKQISTPWFRWARASSVSPAGFSGDPLDFLLKKRMFPHTFSSPRGPSVRNA